jgi:hypothetical protein
MLTSYFIVGVIVIITKVTITMNGQVGPGVFLQNVFVGSSLKSGAAEAAEAVLAVAWVVPTVMLVPIIKLIFVQLLKE